MADEVRNVTIGFESSMPLEVRINRAEFDALREALSGGAGGWHELKTQISEIALDLAKVTFVRIDTEDHRVGF